LDVDGWDVDVTWVLPSVGGPERVACGVWRARRLGRGSVRCSSADAGWGGDSFTYMRVRRAGVGPGRVWGMSC
jgi:hypothetical protein